MISNLKVKLKQFGRGRSQSGFQGIKIAENNYGAKAKAFYTISYMVIVLLIFFLASVPAMAAEKGYGLKLMSSAGGQYDILATAHAMRFNSAAFNYTIITRAPDWTVHILRKDTKEICHCTGAEFERARRGAIGSGVTLDFTTKPTVQPVVFQRLGKRGWDYTYPGGTSKARDIFVSGDKPADVEKIVVRTIDLGLPRQITNLIDSVVCMPLLPGCIYQTIEFQKNSTTFWVVSVSSIKDIQVADSNFALPTNYKDVGKFKGQFLYKSVSGMMDDVFEGLSPSTR